LGKKKKKRVGSALETQTLAGHEGITPERLFGGGWFFCYKERVVFCCFLGLGDEAKTSKVMAKKV